MHIVNLTVRKSTKWPEENNLYTPQFLLHLFPVFTALCPLGIKRIFLRRIKDCAAVRYQYKIKFENFFILRVFDFMAWIDLKTS